MKYIIGVDIGTTSTKSILYTIEGRIVAKSSIGYKLYQDEPDMAEEDPEEIFQAVINTIKTVVLKSDLNNKEILGVSFSSAMHSLILMDKDDHPLTRVITWADNRAARYSEKIKYSIYGKEIYSKTGTPIHSMTPLSKIIWLRHEKKKIFEKTKKFIDIKTYVFFRLFGIYKMDYSIASATGLFNIYQLKWDDLSTKIAGIKQNQLPDLVDTTDYLRATDSKWFQEMGLLLNTKFIFGASDGTLSNLGLDALNEDTLAITIGTSGAVRKVVDQPMTDKNDKLFCYYLANQKWVIGGAVNNGGIILEWVRDTFLKMKRK